MKRILSFLPAAAAGLLAGWLLSKLLVSSSSAAVSAPGASPLRSAAPATPPSNAAGREAWQKLMDARGLPAIAQDQTLPPGLAGGDKTLSRSAARRELEIELARSALSADGINATSLAFPFRGGDAGFAETCARLAKTMPGRALSQVEMVADTFADRISQDTIDRARRLIFREWLKKDPQAALDAARKSGWGQSMTRQLHRLALVMDEWAKLDPASAAAALTDLPKEGPDFERKRLNESVLSAWYRQDPAAARNWAANTADPAHRDSLLSMADELAATTPAAKTAALLTNPQPDHFTLVNTFGEWLSTEPAAAMQKMMSIPPKDKFWQNNAADVAEWWAINSRGETSPEKFLENISTVPPGPQREAILRGLADYGASNDIPFAKRMISEMTEGRERAQAVSGLTELWMRKDPVKTSEWLTSLPPDSDSRNSGVARFAEGLAPDDPERAAQWAATMPDNFWQKAGVMKTVMEKWRAKDPAAAAAWEQGKR